MLMATLIGCKLFEESKAFNPKVHVKVLEIWGIKKLSTQEIKAFMDVEENWLYLRGAYYVGDSIRHHCMIQDDGVSLAGETVSQIARNLGLGANKSAVVKLGAKSFCLFRSVSLMLLVVACIHSLMYKSISHTPSYVFSFLILHIVGRVSV